MGYEINSINSPDSNVSRPGWIVGRVLDLRGYQSPIAGAEVKISQVGGESLVVYTNEYGEFKSLDLTPGEYEIDVSAFDLTPDPKFAKLQKNVRPDCRENITLNLDIQFEIGSTLWEASTRRASAEVDAGQILVLQATYNPTVKPDSINWKTPSGRFLGSSSGPTVSLDTASAVGPFQVTATMTKGKQQISAKADLISNPKAPQPVSGSLSVGLRRTASSVTPDLPLWLIIRRSTDALSFRNYQKFMDVVLCNIDPRTEGMFDKFELDRILGTGGKRDAFLSLRERRYLPFTDSDAYRLLKVATEAFLTVNCGIPPENTQFDQSDVADLISKTAIDIIDANTVERMWNEYLQAVNGTTCRTLPYLAFIAAKFPELRVKNEIFANITTNSEFQSEQCYGLLAPKLTQPCLIELIWSYWHEEGMLAQSMNAISVRFQNRRGPDKLDPLANMEIDPLRPLNNLFWGYIQDEQHRLTVVRRAYEYDHHYGLRMQGRAVPVMRTADSRSQFLQAFHNLLNRCMIFFQQDDDTTVISDGFPVLNALKEVHLILSQGAHNQFGDLPSTARIEMLMQQWLLARPEFREFLPTRIMVAYPEPWMDRVDAMKKLQNWSDVNILHFHDLGVFGEKLLLTIRFGNWVDTFDSDQAKNWARFWRSEIQSYIHAYRAVTGVDISIEPVNSTLPSELLRARLSQQLSQR